MKNKYCSGSVKLRVCMLHLYLYQANIVFPYFQLRQQLYKSQCWSVCRSVCQQRVLQKCYAVGSVFILLVLLKLRLVDHSVVIFCNFSCNSSSICRNVSRFVCLSTTSVILLLVYDCCFCCLVYNISICYSSSLSRNVGLSVGQYVCRSVCLSASNEFYRSDMLLVVNV